MTTVDFGELDRGMTIIKMMIEKVSAEEANWKREVAYLKSLQDRKARRDDNAKQTKKLALNLINAEQKLHDTSGYVRQLKAKLDQLQKVIMEVSHHAGE